MLMRSSIEYSFSIVESLSTCQSIVLQSWVFFPYFESLWKIHDLFHHVTLHSFIELFINLRSQGISSIWTLFLNTFHELFSNLTIKDIFIIDFASRSSLFIVIQDTTTLSRNSDLDFPETQFQKKKKKKKSQSIASKEDKKKVSKRASDTKRHHDVRHRNWFPQLHLIRNLSIFTVPICMSWSKSTKRKSVSFITAPSSQSFSRRLFHHCDFIQFLVCSHRQIRKNSPAQTANEQHWGVTIVRRSDQK